MRHFFWVRIDGSLGGTYTGKGGIAPDVDPRDSNTTNAIASVFRQHGTRQPEFACFLEYVCSCLPPGPCSCANDRVQDSCVSNGVIVPKPSVSVLLDGEPVSTTAASPANRTPLSSVVLKLAGAVPDGIPIAIQSATLGPDLLETKPSVLVFTGGHTNEVPLVVPAHGMTGMVRFEHRRWMTPQVLHLRGWGA